MTTTELMAACPYCKAEAGKPCRTVHPMMPPTPMSFFHFERTLV